MDQAAPAIAMAAMSDSKANATDVARHPSMTITTLRTHVNGGGSAKAAGAAVPDGAATRGGLAQ